MIHNSRSIASEDIKVVEFSFTINNINEFKEFFSKTVYVRGQPWKAQIQKVPCVNGYSVGVYLYSKIQDTLDNWSILANATITLLSSNISRHPYRKSLCIVPFTSKTLNWGITSFISWDDLMSPQNGYVINGRCEFEFSIRADPLQNEKTDDMMKFEIIKKCCDCSLDAEFRLTINKLDGLLGVCSPKFILGNTPWRISVVKIDHDLCIQLNNTKCDKVTSDPSCWAAMSCRIISSDPEISPIKPKFKSMNFHSPYTSTKSSVIKWNELTDPRKKIMKNGSFVVEIEMLIESDRSIGIRKEDSIDVTGSGFVKLKCPICSENLTTRLLSSTLCGHIFCTSCIQGALSRASACPTCKGAAFLCELHPIFLPIN